MASKFVIVGTKDKVIGTRTGRAFHTKKQAEAQLARELEASPRKKLKVVEVGSGV